MSMENERGLVPEYSEEEKIRAAYALNMCMVSVSQIIDYNDLNVLEQEYEGILNNLNLEMMPKDEALLTILKRVLDTITFFRIQEGDKKLIDKEYQQKMKNAIWSAVPNFGLIVAGGNPVTMAISLASQVGIGYMNYRRTKCENDLEHEKQTWQLQRSAMEQFNGLRRELFDTAWRLADTYNFPDEYRLTERQIKQYDEILMDANELRKYERLTTIKDKFVAYPPFWYHYGSTANHIARNPDLSLTKDARMQFLKEASEHFERYWQSNKYALLREDTMASSCALEYIDLLDAEKNRDKILWLLDKAVDFSGNENDVLQLCAMAYLRLGDRNGAENLLRVLVNEQYNTVVNAQLLSGIYVNMALNDKDKAAYARSRYETLTMRVTRDYLIRMPESKERISEKELQKEFSKNQKEMLKSKCKAVIDRCFSDFIIRLGRLIPAPDDNKSYPDYYYSEEGAEERRKDFRDLYNSSYNQKRKDEYLDGLIQCNFVVAYFTEINSFYHDITDFGLITDWESLKGKITSAILSHADQINKVSRRIEERKAAYEDMCEMLTFVSANMFGDFRDAWESQVNQKVGRMGERMDRFVSAETHLSEFCDDHGLPEPDVLVGEMANARTDVGLMREEFRLELLGSEGMRLQREQENYGRIEGVIKEYIPKMKSISGKAGVYFHDEEEFDAYFEKNKLGKYKDIKQKTVVVFDDKNYFTDIDVLFKYDGVVPVIRKKVKTTIPYIVLAGNEEIKRSLDIIKSKKGVSDTTLSMLFPGSLSNVAKNTPWQLIRNVAITSGGYDKADLKAIEQIITAVRPMIDKICSIIVDEERMK